MAKLKKNKRGKKTNPLGEKPKSKQDQKDESTRQSKILPLINKLQSSVPNERAMAMGAIGILAEDTRMRKLLLKEKLILILMEQCLNDSNDEIVVELYGLLRNLAIEEGYDVCKFYWRSNIWASIEAGINKIETSFKFLEENEASTGSADKKAKDKSKIQLLYDFTENLLSLVAGIANSSEDLFDAVLDKIDIPLALVTNLLQWNSPKLRVTIKLYNALLNCLFEFTAESLPFIQKLAQVQNFQLDQLIACVNDPAQVNNKLGKIYVEGIKFNVYEVLHKYNFKQELATEILSTVFDVSTTIDLAKVNETLFKPIDNAEDPITKNENGELSVPFLSSKGEETPEKIQANADLLCVETSLDLIASLLEFISTNEDLIEDPIILSESTLSILIEKVYPFSMELLKFEIDHQFKLQLTEKALVVLNNLTWLFLSNSAIPTEWYERLINVIDITKILLSKENIDYQKQCLNILWGASKSLGPEIRAKLDESMIESLIKINQEFISSSFQDEVEGNLEDDRLAKLEVFLTATGFLGSIASIVENTDITRVIAEFLLQLITFFHDKSQYSLCNEIVIESLNLIYDIFGDSLYSYDRAVFYEGGYIERLQQIEPRVKVMYKRIDKNRNPQLKVRGEEALLNLGRFIQYKQSEYA